MKCNYRKEIFDVLDGNHPKIWAYTRTVNNEVLLVINNFYGEEINVFCTSECSIGWNETRSIIIKLQRFK